MPIGGEPGTTGMIELFMWGTPNGYKASIMLEECGLPYVIRPVDIGKGEQFGPGFLRISPNKKIPAIIDPDGPDGTPMSLFEPGAILLYLAEKAGRFLPNDARGRWAATEWLMFQMGGLGPMLGQAHHFRHYAKELLPYAIERYTSETKRLYRVMDRRLAETPFLAGLEYTVADIAAFPWVRRFERHGVLLEDYPNVQRWYATVDAHPAVKAGLVPLSETEQRGILADDKSHGLLFGNGQYTPR